MTKPLLGGAGRVGIKYGRAAFACRDAPLLLSRQARRCNSVRPGGCRANRHCASSQRSHTARTRTRGSGCREWRQPRRWQNHHRGRMAHRSRTAVLVGQGRQDGGGRIWLERGRPRSAGTAARRQRFGPQFGKVRKDYAGTDGAGTDGAGTDGAGTDGAGKGRCGICNTGKPAAVS